MPHGKHATAETLADHAEGLLGESEARWVATHLEYCGDCRSTALMLEVLSEVLATADPGPMPARYVARINATLARLAIAEPVSPTPTGAGTRGAEILTLTSQRQRLTGLRRVSTAAAAVVLFVGGVALGAQTISNRGRLPAGPEAGQRPRPIATEATTLTAAVFDIPKAAVPDKHGNYVVPDVGTIYLPSTDKPQRTARKIIRPDGVEIVPDPDGNPIYLRPPHTAQPPTSSRPRTTTQPRPSAPAAGSSASSPATPPPSTADPTPPAGPGSGPEPGDKPVPPVDTGLGAGEPYVTQSGAEYNEDNFAGKVMDLVAEAEQHTDPAGDGPAPPGGDAVDPAAPDPSPNQLTAKRFGEQPAGARSAAAKRWPDDPAANSPDLQARVLRCAARTGHRAIAGDTGSWGERRATVVVVQSDNPDQVIGYVFYGECDRGGPVTAQESPWEQRVDRPETAPLAARSTTPPQRPSHLAGSNTQTQVHPSSIPAATPSADAERVRPSQERS